MIKIKDIVGFPSLNYHLENGLSLSENVYRYSSERFIQLFAEARDAWRDGLIELNEEDAQLLESTDIGEYGVFEGEKVPLDLPMKYKNPYQPILEDIAIFGSTYEAVNIQDSYNGIEVEGDNNTTIFTFTDKHGVKRQLRYFKGGSVKLLWFDKKIEKWTTDRPSSRYEDQKVMNTFGKILIKVILPKFKNFTFKAADEIRYRLFRALILSNLNQDKYTLDFDDDSYEIIVHQLEELDEAEYKGRDVQLNKPKRGGPKKFYVYVRNPKTKKVVKVSFGAKDGGGNLAVKLDDPKRRKAFADRHNCDQKKDKTKPGYWSCRVTRYAKSLGMKKNYSGYW